MSLLKEQQWGPQAISGSFPSWFGSKSCKAHGSTSALLLVMRRLTLSFSSCVPAWFLRSCFSGGLEWGSSWPGKLTHSEGLRVRSCFEHVIGGLLMTGLLGVSEALPNRFV